MPKDTDNKETLFDATTRAQIADYLPCALEQAMASYHSFMTQAEVPEDAKGFSAHHSAAKAAIAHIELLIKLAERVQEVSSPAADTSGRQPDPHALTQVVQQAQAEIRAYHDDGNA